MVNLADFIFLTCKSEEYVGCGGGQSACNKPLSVLG